MNKNMPLISIIIPTKNRQVYCRQVIKQIIDTTGDRTEIVIQDNSDDSQLSAYCQELSCARLVYHHESRALSFVDNFSEAVKLAHGEYLCMIGDDDGVLPSIEAAAEYVKRKDLDALIPGLNSVYIWPNEKPIVKNGENGYLVLSYLKNKTASVDPMEEVIKLLQNGAQDYQSFLVPRLYHGIVNRRILQQIYDKKGTYFDGLTPDIYAAIALGLLCKKVEAVQYPITVSGICPSSGSAASATGAHTGELKDAPHFRGHNHYDWNPLVLPVYSVETIWAETALHAWDDFADGDVEDYFSRKRLYVRLWRNYPQFHERIVKEAKQNRISITSIRASALIKTGQKLFRRATQYLTRKEEDVIKHYAVENIHDAVQITQHAVEKIDGTWGSQDA